MRIHIHVLLIFLSLQNVYGKHTYSFYRNMNKIAQEKGTRRIFGGITASISEFPGTCLLSDKNLKPKCTGTIITPQFGITAAHCITKHLYYILYNTRNPKERKDLAVISNVYKHPGFNVVTEDEGYGMDVTKLYHDVGLVESMEPMHLDFPARRTPNLDEILRRSTAKDIYYSKVDILGFGSTGTPDAEELLKVNLRINRCERDTWHFCVCGEVIPGDRARGVCSGDSGGPVILNGTLVAVTSMGPVECTTTTDPSGATSVFTLVSRYVDIINDTINRRSDSLVMDKMVLNSGTRYDTYSNAASFYITFNVWITLIMMIFQ